MTGCPKILQHVIFIWRRQIREIASTGWYREIPYISDSVLE
jgi:hypothetical protein